MPLKDDAAFQKAVNGIIESKLEERAKERGTDTLGRKIRRSALQPYLYLQENPNVYSTQGPQPRLTELRASHDTWQSSVAAGMNTREKGGFLADQDKLVSPIGNCSSPRLQVDSQSPYLRNNPLVVRDVRRCLPRVTNTSSSDIPTSTLAQAGIRDLHAAAESQHFELDRSYTERVFETSSVLQPPQPIRFDSTRGELFSYQSNTPSSSNQIDFDASPIQTLQLTSQTTPVLNLSRGIYGGTQAHDEVNIDLLKSNSLSSKIPHNNPKRRMLQSYSKPQREHTCDVNPDRVAVRIAASKIQPHPRDEDALFWMETFADEQLPLPQPEDEDAWVRSEPVLPLPQMEGVNACAGIRNIMDEQLLSMSQSENMGAWVGMETLPMPQLESMDAWVAGEPVSSVPHTADMNAGIGIRSSMDEQLLSMPQFQDMSAWVRMGEEGLTLPQLRDMSP